MRKKNFVSSFIYVLITMMFCMMLFTGCNSNNSKGIESDAIRELKTYENRVQGTGKINKVELSNIINRLDIDAKSLEIQVYYSQNKKNTQYNYNNIPDTLQLNFADKLTLRIKTPKINVVEAVRIKYNDEF